MSCRSRPPDTRPESPWSKSLRDVPVPERVVNGPWNPSPSKGVDGCRCRLRDPSRPRPSRDRVRRPVFPGTHLLCGPLHLFSCRHDPLSVPSLHPPPVLERTGRRSRGSRCTRVGPQSQYGPVVTCAHRVGVSATDLLLRSSFGHPSRAQGLRRVPYVPHPRPGHPSPTVGDPKEGEESSTGNP